MHSCRDGLSALLNFLFVFLTFYSILLFVSLSFNPVHHKRSMCDDWCQENTAVEVTTFIIFVFVVTDSIYYVICYFKALFIDLKLV